MAEQQQSEQKAEGYFDNKQGFKIFHRSWKEVEEPIKGIVFFSHGYGEHCSRPGYDTLARRLNQNGFIVHAMDHQGHGLSGGEQVYVNVFQDYIDDFLQFFDLKAQEHPELPYFIFSHSMGTLIALGACFQLLEKKPEALKGIVLSGSAIMVDPKIDTSFNRFAAALLAAITPHWAPPFIEKLNINDLSRNPEAVQRYADDPKIYKGGFKARQANEVLKEATRLISKLESFTYPALIVHGTQDKICNPQGSVMLHEKFKSINKKLHMLEGFFHEPFEDPECETFLKLVTEFFVAVAYAR
jgi:acylglycerol lipase